MARPKGSRNKSTEKKMLKENGADPFKDMTDSEILGEIHTRFEVMSRIGKSCISGDIRSAIISGAAGIGKTYTIDTLLQRRAMENPNFKYNVIKGAISPVNLFKVLQDYRHAGNVVVMDDADNIFFDDNGVSILKAALDSTPERWISWLAESHALREKGEQAYDKEFLYNGTMVFITNTDFQGIVDKGKSKLVPHFEALMSRSMYLDLKVHHRRAVSIWVSYMVHRTNMLVNHYDITKEQQKTAVDWIMENREDMRTLSLRDAMKIGQMMRSEPETWEDTAKIVLLRNKMS